MAFTTPATSTAGTVLTASFLNTNVRDNVAWIATDSPSCRAYKTTDLTVATATATAVPLDAERFDNAALHSTASNTHLMTIPAGGGGKYLFGTNLRWDTNATGLLSAQVILNGATNVSYVENQATSSANISWSIASSYALAAADTLAVTVFQSSGGNRTLSAVGNHSPEFWVCWFRT